MTIRKPVSAPDSRFALDDSQLLMGKQAAAILGTTHGTLSSWARRGLIPFATTPGGHRRYREADVRAFLAEHGKGKRSGKYNTAVREAVREARVRSVLGQRFGMLVAREQAPESYKSDGVRKDPYVICDCDCGGTKTVRVGTLQHHYSGWDNCGCLSKERVSKAVSARHTVHGHSSGPRTLRQEKSPEYASWSSMKNRCYGARTDNADYGGRGITVCDRWLVSFAAFLEDMGRRPGPQYSLDRIDVDGNYEPGNCRWATPAEQMANRRQSAWLGPATWTVIRDVLEQAGTPEAAAALTALDRELTKPPRRKPKAAQARLAVFT